MDHIGSRHDRGNYGIYLLKPMVSSSATEKSAIRLRDRGSDLGKSVEHYSAWYSDQRSHSLT